MKNSITEHHIQMARSINLLFAEAFQSHPYWLRGFWKPNKIKVARAAGHGRTKMNKPKNKSVKTTQQGRLWNRLSDKWQFGYEIASNSSEVRCLEHMHRRGMIESMKAHGDQMSYRLYRLPQPTLCLPSTSRNTKEKE